MGIKVTKDAGRSEGWWSTPAAGWSDVSDAVYSRWHRYGRSTPKLDDDVARSALAFGYGARSAYGEHTLWPDLVVLLEADWRAATAAPAQAWADVQKVVKEGWTAAANTEPIQGESMAAEPPPVEPPDETNVPGGRLDRHNA